MNFNISNLAHIVFSVQKNVEPQKPAPQQMQKFSLEQKNAETLANLSAKELQGTIARIQIAATNIMNNMQQNMFLRDMMGLPKDWTSLLNEFLLTSNSQVANIINNLNTTGQNTMQEALLALLSSNSKVDLAALAAMLNKNAALMSDKLIKYMGDISMHGNIAQLKDIMLIGASIASSAKTNPNEFIRDIIQMYLPWLPLVPPKQEDLNEIQAKISGGSEGDAQISFFISTTNLGYFKIEIVVSDEPELYINNVYEKEVDELKENLVKTLKENIKKNSPRAKVFYSGKVDKELDKKDKQLYIVKSSDSMVGLILLQLVSRLIFEFDEVQAQRFLKASEN
ncbi:MAG: hypothetical protein K6A44_01440 [bacterium]|nr:hypothetical protein [bacterium]